MLPAVDLTRDLKDLAYLASAGESLEELLHRGLQWLGRLAPYDLAAVFELHGNTLVVRAAEGPLASPRVMEHVLDLAKFPSVRAAMERKQARVFTHHDHADGDGDPFDGVLDLPDGHACMVVPLCTAQACHGLLTLDRSVCGTYAPQVVDLVEVYAQLLTLSLRNAEQAEVLERLHSQDQEQLRLLTQEVRGDGEAVLEASRSAAVREVARRARQVAGADTPVLVLGETGTGKEQLARSVHAWSPRSTRPFIKINCAAIPSGLLESELFGHVRGSFTGATQNRAGRFQTANGGTLLLDEIGELPLELQGKLLRVLQEGTFEPVGSDRTVKVDVRIIAATHVDLERAVEEKQFREDLYYRLNVFPLHLPSLRERLEDLEALCASLLAQLAERSGKRGFVVSPDGIAKLRTYAWPGNVRELANVLERATILSPSRIIGPAQLDLPGRKAGSMRSTTMTLMTMEDMERAHIKAVLSSTQGRIYGKGGAAEILDMKPSTLQSRMKKLGIARLA